METRTTEFSIRNLQESNSIALSDILSAINSKNTFVNHPILYSEPDAGLLSDILQQHKIEHGVSLGYLQNGDEEIVGLAGFHYLEEVALYEAVCILLPEYQPETGYAIEFTIHEAFYNLGMDKICARALPGSAAGTLFKSNGFTYCGERIFIDDAQGHLWDYYELENEGNLVSAAGQGGYAQSDWDSIF